MDFGNGTPVLSVSAGAHFLVESQLFDPQSAAVVHGSPVFALTAAVHFFEELQFLDIQSDDIEQGSPVFPCAGGSTHFAPVHTVDAHSADSVQASPCFLFDSDGHNCHTVMPMMIATTTPTPTPIPIFWFLVHVLLRIASFFCSVEFCSDFICELLSRLGKIKNHWCDRLVFC